MASPLPGCPSEHRDGTTWKGGALAPGAFPCASQEPSRQRAARGGGGVYLPSCLPTRTLQSQPWASSVFLAVSKCVAHTKWQPQLMLSAHFSRLLLPFSPFRSPAVLQSITHAGTLTCSPHPLLQSPGPPSQGTAPRDASTLRHAPPGAEMTEGSLW